MDAFPPGAREVTVERVAADFSRSGERDVVAVEEPLEIQLGFGSHPREVRTLSITMRTPGYDRELAAGFLFTEGILTDAAEILTVLVGRNLVRVELTPEVQVRWPSLERHVYTSSSCGICGTASIEAVQQKCAGRFLCSGLQVRACVIASLPERLRDSQRVFARTGGLHAAALFDSQGDLQGVFEDVGRHNALDKLIGARFLAGQLPASGNVLLVSGRVSFELVQKAWSAGIPVLAAVGAPSSLAVELATEAGMTLAGFVRDGRFNLYSGVTRIQGDL